VAARIQQRIADELGVSLNTLKTRIRQLCERLEVGSLEAARALVAGA